MSIIRNKISIILCIAYIFRVCHTQVPSDFVRPTCSKSTCRFGQCEQLDFDFRCHCEEGVKGILCDRLIEEDDNLCLSHPCWNGAVCRQIGNDFTCDCPVGNSGKNCRTIDNAPCQNNPCQNNAVCRVLSGNGFMCTCVGDWSGQFCDTPIPLCSRKEPCKNGGTCSNNACNCAPGFTGQFCQEKITDVTVTELPPLAPTSLADQKIIVTNKGGYVAEMKVDYVVNAGANQIPVTQTGSITVGQAYAFYIPGSIDLQGEPGAILTVKAAGGIQIMRTKLHLNPSCFHVWGTTLIPFWSPINC